MLQLAQSRKRARVRCHCWPAWQADIVVLKLMRSGCTALHSISYKAQGDIQKPGNTRTADFLQ